MMAILLLMLIVSLSPYSFYLDGVLNTNAFPLDTSFWFRTGTYDITGE